MRAFSRQTNDKAQSESGSKSFKSVVQTTIVTKGSQESILEKYDSDGKIVRTDAFTVTVESNKD